jgi:hypothetical protein
VLEPTYYALTHLLYTRDKLSEGDRLDIRVMKFEQLRNHVDDAKDRKTAIVDLQKYGEFYLEDNHEGVW